MARPRQPIDVITANGRSNKTKAEIAERKASEPKSPDMAIICPDFVDTALNIKRFDNYARLIKNLGVWSELDADTLGRYVVAQTTYEAYVKPIREAIRDENFSYAETLQRQQDRAFKQATTCASALGLTISSRCKLVVPVVEDDDTPDL